MLHRDHHSLITSTLLNNMLDSLIKILQKLSLSSLKEKFYLQLTFSIHIHLKILLLNNFYQA